MKTLYRKNDKIQFINPYTFIPIRKEDGGKKTDIRKQYPREGARLHTGYLKCDIYVKTPLAIPDTEPGMAEEIDLKDDDAEKSKIHMKYPFFSYGEGPDRKLAIPGSSIRGEIRSLFEAATDSCMSTLRPDTKLSRRIENRKAYGPGILKRENGEWRLYDAKRYILASRDVEVVNGTGYTQCDAFNRIQDYSFIKVEQDKKDGKWYRYIVTSDNTKLKWGDKVSFSVYKELNGENLTYRKRNHKIWEGIVESISKVEEPGEKSIKEKTGYVYVGEMCGTNKHGESVFECKKNPENIGSEKLERAFQDLLKTLDIYQDEGINKTKGHSGYKAFEEIDMADRAAVPLWYKYENGKVYLSFAAIGRAMYDTSLNELAGDKKPCEKRGQLCEACALFGMASQEEKFGSRIRFTDAVQKGTDEIKTEEVTLQVLGEPRYSYLPFYAKNNVNSYDEPEAEISGRKFYWHNLRTADHDCIYHMEEQNALNNTMELVMPEEHPLFEFTVYYDGITEEQLEKLIWCINLGENKKEGEMVQGTMAHKIGHGKPLGLGSVKFFITRQEERVFEKGEYEWVEQKILPKKENPGMKNYDILLKIMDMEEPLKSQTEKNLAEEIKIEYPDVRGPKGRRLPEKRKNEEARHNWYSQNKIEKSPMSLPEPLNEDQALSVFQKVPWVKGDEYDAEVSGFNKKKTVAYIKVEGRVEGQIYYKDVKGAECGKIDSRLRKGRKIEVVFKEQKDGHLNFCLAEE